MNDNRYRYEFAADASAFSPQDVWISVTKFDQDNRHWDSRSGISIDRAQVPGLIAFLQEFAATQPAPETVTSAESEATATVRHWHLASFLHGYMPDPDAIVCIGDCTAEEALATFREHVWEMVADSHDCKGTEYGIQEVTEANCFACYTGITTACDCSYCAAETWVNQITADAIDAGENGMTRGCTVGYRRSSIHPETIYDASSLWEVTEIEPECYACDACNAEPGEVCRYGCIGREQAQA